VAAARNTKTAAAVSPNEARILLLGAQAAPACPSRWLAATRRRAARKGIFLTRRPKKSLLKTESPPRTRSGHVVSRNLKPVTIRIAKVNRMRDAVILKMKGDATLFQFALGAKKVFPVRAQCEMEDVHRFGLA
jgi:hypothetical protein